MDHMASPKATKAAPTRDVATPGYITCSRPKRSASLPSGTVKTNMPAVWNMWEKVIADSEWPW
jgi:hypothetical protein